MLDTWTRWTRTANEPPTPSIVRSHPDYDDYDRAAHQLMREHAEHAAAVATLDWPDARLDAYPEPVAAALRHHGYARRWLTAEQWMALRDAARYRASIHLERKDSPGASGAVRADHFHEPQRGRR